MSDRDSTTGGPARLALADRLYERSNLTASQLIFWVGQQLEPDVPLYNMAFLFTLDQPIAPAAFSAAVATLVSSADILRTTIHEVEGVPQQRVRPALRYVPELVDLAAERDPQAALLGWARRRARRPFDFSHRLFDMALLRLSQERFAWYLNQHHITTDGTSDRLIVRHVSDLYGAALRGELPARIELPQFADYLVHERGYRQSAEYRRLADYWQRRLSERIDPISFARAVHRGSTTAVARVGAALGRERSRRLRRFARRREIFVKTHHVSIFNVLAAALLAYLHRLTGNRRLSLGVTFANRQTEAFAETIGPFVETLPAAVTIDEEETLGALVRSIAAAVAEARRHSPYALPSPARNRTYDVLLNYQVTSFPQFHGRPVGVEMPGVGHAHQSVILEAQYCPAERDFKLDFYLNREVFSAAHRRQVPGHVVQLLDALLEDPDRPLRGARFLTAAEMHHLVTDLNQTKAPTARRAVHRLFEDRARRGPDNVAIHHGVEAMSYERLDADANRLAQHLRTLGVGVETPVGLLLDRSPEMIAALLAILKAGGYYVPLGLGFPDERLALMLRETGTQIVVTREGLLGRLPHAAGPAVCLDRDAEIIARSPATGLEEQDCLEQLAYIIYTSGSTGRPKGVMIEHGSLANYIEGARREYELRPEDRILQFGAITFDVSALEIYTALTGGASLVLDPGAERLRSPREFFRVCAQAGITILILPTAYWHTLVAALDDGETLPPSIRWVTIGAEHVRPPMLARWQRRVGPRVRLVNSYGPTETTVASTRWQLPPEPFEPDRWQGSPIGRPVPNTRAYILGEDQLPLPLGVAGELCLGGAGVARGYLGRPTLTAERFVPDSFAAGGRLYRTGDLARYRADGTIEFLGRIDRQVQIRGFRVELGEIETALNEHPDIEQCVVGARDDDGEATPRRLIAWVAAADDAELKLEELHAFLETRLPEYMIPSSFVILEALPLTAAGKVDVGALPEPDGARPRLATPYEAPKGPVEELLVEVWEEVLGTSPVGVRDNFFLLGGHSLLAMQVIARLRRELDVDLSLRELFEHPVVADLAALVGRSLDAGLREDGRGGGR